MNQQNNLFIQVSHRFAHSAVRVFDAWLDVKLASQFMFATETGEVVRCDIDPRVGGEFVITDRREDGDVEHRGQYIEIDRPHKIVFTFGIPAFSPDNDLVTIEITPSDDGCDLTLTTEISPQWADYVDSARDGWSMILNSLDAALTT